MNHDVIEWNPAIPWATHIARPTVTHQTHLSNPNIWAKFSLMNFDILLHCRYYYRFLKKNKSLSRCQCSRNFARIRSKKKDSGSPRFLFNITEKDRNRKSCCKPALTDTCGIKLTQARLRLTSLSYTLDYQCTEFWGHITWHCPWCSLMTRILI